MHDTTTTLEQQFLSSLLEVLGSPEGTLGLHEPEFRGNEWAYVKECLDTGWVSSVGRYVDEFEVSLAEYTGAKHAVAVVNGTAALHIALQLAGVRPGDEVIVPALTFVATANAVAHCGAVPHFVDSDSATLGLDPAALDAHLSRVAEKSAGGLRNVESGRRIAAIVPMHVFGHPMRIDALLEVASRHGVPIVEDAAESLGSTFKGQHTGTFGLMGVLSFNGNKIVTTGGGGAIVTNDPEIARHAKHLTTTARKAHAWEYVHDEVGYNYRLPNLNAALGCAQMERLDDFVSRKRKLASRYGAAFASVRELEFVTEPADGVSNYWLNAVRLRKPDMSQRDALLGIAATRGFQCRPVWRLMHRLPMYSGAPRAELPVAEVLEASLVNVPSSARLGGAES